MSHHTEPTPALQRAEKAARLRRARGIPGYIPTDRITGHIAVLQQAGWTNTEIADTAGVDRRTIHNILHGYVARTHRPTAAAILALRPEDVPNRVPAIGTRRRIQALAYMGWPIAHIGAAAGMRGTQVNELMAGRRKRIPREQAEAVAALFRARLMTPGPSARTRATAARNGWASPLAWDDIDDPAEKPRRRRAAA
ncbi:hypothetical protein PV518_40840 [Streptomyces sp. ND04-05B]|uniref:hypothetical protein n=1 Tax=Streptomyces sp. ND04-05B TaxID=3028693 RepID=UPI0029A93951|nr:hypothetical protein [Streptomyces sp. ND04-05B]MDX3068434.1 hypothetical protein [Streptomyces sp. ND04-05B]